MKINKKLTLLLSLLLVVSVFLSACNSSDSSESAGSNGDEDISGTTITALLPPWTKIPDSMLDQFKEETGVTVDLQTMGWDDIHDKIVTSAAAGVSPADVTEFDWSWVGQFGAAGWFEPLDQYFDSETIDDTSTMPIFKYKDNYIAMPYSNDFRVTYLNESVFKDAGVTETPSTPEELMKAAEKIKNNGGMDYPMGIPLSATEGSATPWYLMTKAFGGELFDEDGNPQFTDKSSAGYQAMEYLISGMKENKVIDPSAVGIKDTDVISNFQNGKIAIDLAGWVGNMSLYEDDSKSSVAGNVKMKPTPGKDGDSRTFGLVEGYGIPKASKHKKAAAEFIKFLVQPEQMEKMYTDLGLMPNRQSVLEDLNDQGKLVGGDTILDVLPTVEPLFKQGTPSWYPKFSTDVATTINQIAKGSMTVDEGISHIADNVKSIQGE
ncbi:extracellular solute-binding protein [Halobacillus rhizosphaerae]|uniref:ABC transporter substrate-binding protein n=1 Tax=Halobacillus rhizosphaerae TaxID=3064889 RepID=UPI00398A532C